MKTKKNNQIFTTLFAVVMLLFVSSCKSDDDSGSNQQMQDDGLTGNYRGTWNSTTSTGAVFTDFPISVRITGESMSGDETILTGEFFATSGFTSCCGSDNDGTMTIRILNDDITSFSFNDQIVGCTGNFSGSGTISSNDTFIIDFTGNDCDGEHDGVISIRK